MSARSTVTNLKIIRLDLFLQSRCENHILSLVVSPVSVTVKITGMMILSFRFLELEATHLVMAQFATL
jgi:hypothetical protein